MSVFVVFAASHLLAAAYSPIQDCDEVFNFWEPTHYLHTGYGLQTWELSPEYAIRSWLYTSLHAVPTYLLAYPFFSNKLAWFYVLRALLGVMCATCENRLYVSIRKSVSPRVAAIFALICASSAGMFHASVSYLPSTFAMYTTMLAAANFLDSERQNRFARGMVWLAVGTVIGWPFVAVLAVPFVFGEIYSSLLMRDTGGLFGRLMACASQSIGVLGLEIIVDSTFYRKLVCVPFNIVWYNVFASGKGPNIYGTERWHFYIRNLLINFNFWFLLAILALPLLPVQWVMSARRTSFHNRHVTAMTVPFYIWLAIFTAQPHKEERFMYPIYPFIAFNAAISLHIILYCLGATYKKSWYHRPPASLRLLVIIAFIILCTLLGLLRIASLVTAYSAPLTLYGNLHTHINSISATTSTSSTTSAIPTPNTNTTIQNICVAKEWYRYPSTYHLPPTTRLKFIKSAFSGLLPGEFESGEHWTRQGTYLIPSGMNDANIEDMGKYVDISSCDYLVDSSSPSAEPSALEPDYVHGEVGWERVECVPFLDAQATGVVGRLFWVPDWAVVPRRWRRVWGEYCLLRRREGKEEKNDTGPGGGKEEYVA